MNYDNNPFDGPNEFDYYDAMSVRDAKHAVSRTTMGLFLFGAATTVFMIILSTILLFALGKDGYIALASNPYFYIPMGTVAMYAIGFPLLWIMIKNLPTRRRKTQKTLTIPELIAAIPVMQFAASIGSYIGLGLDGVFQELFNTTSENPVDSLTDGVPVWLMIATTVIIAPIVEEFIFRKLILNRLSVYGNVFAIIMSAALFGIFHGNLYQMFYAFTVGLILGYVTVKGGSWLYGVGLHLFMNFMNGALPTLLEEHLAGYEKAAFAYIEGDAETFIENYDSFMIAGSYAVIVGLLSIAGAIILFSSLTKRLIHVSNSPESAIPIGKMPIVVFCNVGMLLFLLYSALMIVNEYILII